MTIDEMEAKERPPEVPEGCTYHAAYGDWRCKRGTKSCGVYHKDVKIDAPPPIPIREIKELSGKGRWARARAAIDERETMALAGQCYHCEGKMKELQAVLRLPGIRYFVCSINKAHTVVIMSDDEEVVK